MSYLGSASEGLMGHTWSLPGSKTAAKRRAIVWDSGDYLAFQLATVIPIIAKSMRPDSVNNEKEILWLISLGNVPPNPRTRKLIPRVITSHRPICSMILDECFKLGVVKTSLAGFKPKNRNICLLNIPTKIVIIPKINQKGYIVLSPFVLVLWHPTVRAYGLRQRLAGLCLRAEREAARSQFPSPNTICGLYSLTQI
jgi:hypothetical protein